MRSGGGRGPREANSGHPVKFDMNPYGLLGSLQALSWRPSAVDPLSLLANRLIDLLIGDKRTRDRVIEA